MKVILSNNKYKYKVILKNKKLILINNKLNKINIK